MSDTRREMSQKLSKSDPNLYDRIRGSLSKDLFRSRIEEFEGLRGEVIPVCARILAVAESFDFITNKSGYRANPWTPADAIRDISENSGSWYDPAVVDSLRALYERPAREG